MASEDDVILWPPDGDFVMNVAGFQEAYQDSVDVLVNDRLVVKVVSPAGLTLLKLVAWEDRHATQPRKDAADIAYVLHHAGTLLGEETLYGEYFEIVEALGFDFDLAAPNVLGHKIADIASHINRLEIEQTKVFSCKDGQRKNETAPSDPSPACGRGVG